MKMIWNKKTEPPTVEQPKRFVKLVCDNCGYETFVASDDSRSSPGGHDGRAMYGYHTCSTTLGVLRNSNDMNKDNP